MAQQFAHERPTSLLTVLCSSLALMSVSELALSADPLPAERSTDIRSDDQAQKSETGSPKLMVLERGSSAKPMRLAAARALPLNRLTVKNRARADEILKSLSLFRRLPTMSFPTQPEVYQFFAAHPDVAVSIWRVMEISKFQMWQTGRDDYEADTGDGSIGFIHVLYRSPQQNLILCDGHYKSPLLSKPIRAQSLIHLQTRFRRGEDGETYADHHADLFVSFPSQTVEAAAKIVSPVSNLIADRNFREISLFVHMMSLAMCNQPGWVERVADRLEGVLAIRKSQLLKLTAQMYVAARKREERRTGDAGDVLEPLRRASQSSDRPAIKAISNQNATEPTPKPRIAAQPAERGIGE